MKIAAGLELEWVAAPPKSKEAALLRTHNTELPCAQHVAPYDLAQRIAETRATATAVIAQLPMLEPLSAARRHEWLAQIPEFSTTELINFALYHSLSVPTLNTHPRQSSHSYDQTVTGYYPSKPLAFRFGTGLYQQGYYDNPGICEARTHPMPIEALRANRARILHELGRAASYFGQSVFLRGEHVSVSAFSTEGEPYFDDPRTHLLPYRMAVSGLAAAYDQHLAPISDRPAIRFGAHRHNDVRVMPGRLEYRARRIGGTHMTWLQQGLRQGLSSATHTAEMVRCSQMLHLQRQASFDKTTIEDLHLYRLLEYGSIDENNKVVFNFDETFGHYWHAALQGLLGRQISNDPLRNKLFLQNFFAHAVELSCNGYLMATTPSLHKVLSNFTTQEAVGTTLADLPQINRQLTKIKILGNTPTIAHVHYPHNI